MKQKKQLVIVIGVIAVILLLVFSSRMFYIIQPGERAIIFRPFTSGLDKEDIRLPGFQVVAPWNDMHVYDVKEQKAEETMDVLDKNGLKVIIDISVRFNPIYDKIGFLHEVFGKYYINQLVIPEVRSSVRQVAGRYTAEEIYSTKRSEVEQAIIDETNRILSNNFIDMRALRTSLLKSRSFWPINLSLKRKRVKPNAAELLQRENRAQIKSSTIALLQIY